MDATVVSPVRRDGQPRPRADQQPGPALDQVVDRKHQLQTSNLPLPVTAASPALPTGCLRRGSWVRARSCDCSRRRGLASGRRGVVRCGSGRAPASFASLRAHACSLLELPIEGPSDPTDDQEVPAGSRPPAGWRRRVTPAAPAELRTPCADGKSCEKKRMKLFRYSIFYILACW